MPADRVEPGMPLAPERLLVSITALGIVAALLPFRALDDNRLTSWEWVFAAVDPARLLALVASGIVAAHFSARLRPPPRPGAFLFVTSFAIAACFWGEPEAIVDASRYFTQAKSLAVYGVGHFLREWGREISAWTDLPLVPFLYGLVFALFGESRIYIQALTTLLFAGSVVLTYLIGKALWDEEVGFLGGGFLLAIPYLLTQVPSMLVDVPAMFFFTLAIFAVILALRQGGPGRILLASLAVFMGLLSKYSSWLTLSALPVACVVQRRDSPRSLRTGCAVGLLSAALVAAAVLSRREVFSEQIALLIGYQAPGLRRWGESLVSTYLFQVHPFLTLAALASAWVAFRRRDARWAIVAWPVLLLLALQVRRARYAIPTFPMLALMGAYGLQVIRASEVRRLVLGCAVASSLIVALYGYLPFLRSVSAMNLKRAGEYLDSIDEKRVEVFTLPQAGSIVNPAVSVPILDLFTAKRVTYRAEAFSLTPARPVDESPLRFTWEHRLPGYYLGEGAGADAAVVVVSADEGDPLPQHLVDRLRRHRLARTFADDQGVFQFRTMVRVYRPSSP